MPPTASSGNTTTTLHEVLDAIESRLTSSLNEQLRLARRLGLSVRRYGSKGDYEHGDADRAHNKAAHHVKVGSVSQPRSPRMVDALPILVPARTHEELAEMRARARSGKERPTPPRTSQPASSPRRAKPVTWNVVPTSMVLSTGTALPEQLGEAGLTLTGMRDAAFRDALPKILQAPASSPRRGKPRGREVADAPDLE